MDKRTPAPPPAANETRAPRPRDDAALTAESGQDEYSVQVSQLSLVDGIWQDQPDHLGSFQAERLDPSARGRGQLFILVDVSGETEGRPEVERELVQEVRRVYTSGRGSSSGRLSEALSAANALLYNMNSNLPRDQRRMAGVSAVVLRGGDVYIEQTGPGLVYVIARDHLSQFPAVSPWLDEDSPSFGPGQPASSPLGTHPEYNGDLAHIKIEPGDVIILAMRALAHLVSRGELRSLAARSAAQVTSRLESLVADSETDMAIMVVAVDAEKASRAKPAASQSPRRSRAEVEPSAAQLAAVQQPATAAPQEPPAGAVPQETAPGSPEKLARRPLTGDDSGRIKRAPPRTAPPLGPAAQASVEPIERTENPPELKPVQARPSQVRPAAPPTPPASQPELPLQLARVRPSARESLAPSATIASARKEAPAPAPAPAAAGTLIAQSGEAAAGASAPTQPSAVADSAGTAAPYSLPSGEAEEAGSPDQRLERLRQERRLRRQAQAAAQPRPSASPLAPFWSAIGAFLRTLAGFGSRMESSPSLQRVSAQSNRGLNTVFTALGRGLHAVLRIILPGLPERDRLMPRRASSQPLWLKAVALLLPLLFIGLAAGMYYQQVRARDNQFKDLVAQAQQLETQSEKDTDKALARAHLNQALGIVNDARKLNDSEAARTVYFRILDQLNEVNGIKVLPWMLALATYADPNSKPAQVVAHENDVFVLDRGSQRLYRYTLNDVATEIKPAPNEGLILSAGSKIGERAVADMADMIWVEPGASAATGALAIVDNGGLIILYDPTDGKLRAVPADSKSWGPVPAAASYFSNLYLLAPARSQVFKYVPAANGYTAPPLNYFPTNALPDLSRAVDMSVDGDVWILRADGGVLRYHASAPVPFFFSGLDLPLSNPVALFTSPNANSLYVADAGNARVVQFDKNGKFQRQFKPYSQQAHAFEGLRAIFVDELKSQLYFLSRSSAFLTKLPK